MRIIFRDIVFPFYLKTLGVLCIFYCLLFTSCSPQKPGKNHHMSDLAAFVDPFIGTDAHGHTYPGASLPFGMVQLSPDNGVSGWDWCSGYHYSDSIIVGFSHLHLSGTGIGDLADVSFMPTHQTVDFSKTITSRTDLDYHAKYRHDKEFAAPGYYRVQLEESDILVELTATERAGMQQYTSAKDGLLHVVIDLGFAINWDRPVDTYLYMYEDNAISGHRHSTGWAKNQRVFFHTEFSKSFSTYYFVDDDLQISDSYDIEGKKVKGLFTFEMKKGEKLIVKTGLSTVDNEGARLNVKTECPGWDFEYVQELAYAIWNYELNKIKVESEDAELKKVFYTSLYHSFMAPVMHSDIDGRYRGADDQVKKTHFDYYSTFSLWDTFRAAKPLYTILQPHRINDFIRTMLAHYDEYGLLPVWSLAANETNTMTGYHAIPVITDAWFKGFRDYDVDKAYEAMKASAMQDIRGVNFLKEYGYIPADLEEESVTKTLEYAYDDWCIAQMAKALSKKDDYAYFTERAGAYKYLFDEVTGFMRGKMLDGSWKPGFDPKYSAHRVGAEYTEGNAWQHSWFVPHDIEGLIQLFGSRDRFVQKLDSLFNEDSEITGENISVDISGLIGQYAHGNEPSHHIAYMYNYAGIPWKAQDRLWEIMKTQYTAKPDGLCGNEDCGQMSAWYIFSAMGFYPVNPSESIYVIGRPLFERMEISLHDGKNFEIIAPGADKEGMYIQSVKLNGSEHRHSYIRHEDIVNGGVLEFEMGPSKSSWATHPDDFPPSMTEVK
jgi:predicted alpha-1,2-mannosidase